MSNSLEQISNATLRFLSPLSLIETYRTIVEEALQLTSGDEGLILLEQKNSLKYVYRKPENATLLQLRRKGFTYKSYKEQKIFVINRKDIISAHPEIKKDNIQSVIFVPLSYKGRSNGVLIIRFKKDFEIGNDMLQLLQVFGNFASMAIRKAELYDNTRQAIELRDDFLSLASHELRTPLTSINGYMQLLYNHTKKLDTLEATWIKEVYQEVQRLTELIKDLLEVNRARVGQLSFSLQECQMHLLVEQAIRQMEHHYPERIIHFTIKNIFQLDDLIIGDKIKIVEAIEALLSNAIKFSPANSVVEVSLETTKKNVSLCVTDVGIGIPPHQVSRIMDGFYKAKDNLQHGMGVGLLLAKHVIEYHKGTLLLHARRKKGVMAEIKLRRAYE